MYRYERKFKLASPYYDIIKNQIELKGWFKQYPDRLVNNIYLDNLSNSCFYDSIEGHLNKKKYRIRWYGDQLRYVEKIRLAQQRILRSPCRLSANV